LRGRRSPHNKPEQIARAVFAPTNAAFAKLPAGTVDNLLKPENKAQLQSVLTYHVVSGKLMAKDVLAAITAGGGKAVVTTVQGGKLTVSLMGTTVMLTDSTVRQGRDRGVWC
jgi:uncharacterized surface protein with fasciclin (FAS1) repeats